MDTDTWLPAAIAFGGALVGAGTSLLGSWLQQRRSDTLEERRWRREEDRRKEDRTFELRRQAYVEFLNNIPKLRRSPDSGKWYLPPFEDWHERLRNAYQPIDLYGGRLIGVAGGSLMLTLLGFIQGWFTDDEVRDAVRKLQDLMRHDLGIPVGTIPEEEIKAGQPESVSGATVSDVGDLDATSGHQVDEDAQ